MTEKEREINACVNFALKKKGMTQNELAEKIGITPQLLSNVLNFRRRYSTDSKFRKYAYEILELDIEEEVRENDG